MREQSWLSLTSQLSVVSCCSCLCRVIGLRPVASVVRPLGRSLSERWGWSSTSQKRCRSDGGTAADEALIALWLASGGCGAEPKVVYGGADGMPIREEIVEEITDTVITRNTYGAQCLNVREVVFADDCQESDSCVGTLLALIAGIIGGIVLTGQFDYPRLSKFYWWSSLASAVQWSSDESQGLLRRFTGTADERALRRIRASLVNKDDWLVRIYRTPAGIGFSHARYALLTTQSSWLGSSNFMSTRSMPACVGFNIAFAPFDGKPWRIGITEQLKPRPRVLAHQARAATGPKGLAGTLRRLC